MASSCNLTSASPPDQNETEFCADWAKAICQVGSGQCTFDVTTCAANQTNVCTAFVDSLQGGTRQYSQPNGAACIGALNDTYSGNQPSIAAQVLLNTAAICSKVVAGNAGSDQPCTTDSDCTGNLICTPTVLGGSNSVCAAAVSEALGDFCGGPGQQCAAGSFCQSQGPKAAPICVVGGPTGATCSATAPCVSSDTCGPDGTCQPQGTTGAACTTNSDCTSGYCDPYPPMQCTNGLTFARGSDDCNGIESAGTVPIGDASSPDGGG